MTNENFENENEPDNEDNGDHLPYFELELDHQAVIALNNALLIKWDEIEEGLQEVGPSPLVTTMLSALEMFNHSQPLLVDSDKKCDIMQFGPELYAFKEVAGKIHDLLNTDEFGRAQWGCVYAYVQDSIGIPAAVLDTFNISYDVKEGYSIEGIKPLFTDGCLIPEAWGAAHSMIESGDYDPAHLDNLPRPDERYFFSAENAC